MKKLIACFALSLFGMAEMSLAQTSFTTSQHQLEPSSPKQFSNDNNLPNNQAKSQKSSSNDNRSGSVAIDCACESEYRVGDSVTLLVDNPSNHLKLRIGQQGTVVCGVINDNQVLVEWRNWDGGHDGNGLCECPVTKQAGDDKWFMNCDDIALDESYPMSQTEFPDEIDQLVAIVHCLWTGHGTTTDNRWGRHYYIEKDNIIENVEWFVHTNTQTAPPPLVTVNLWTSQNDTPSVEGMTLVASSSKVVENGSLLYQQTEFDEPVQVLAGTYLFVEVGVPGNEDGESGDQFIIGEALSGTGHTYILTDLCGIYEWTSFEDLGFPNEEVVISINGYDAFPGDPSEWVDSNGNGIGDNADSVVACLGDLNGDGTVGVDDLLSLIGAWGVCP